MPIAITTIPVGPAIDPEVVKNFLGIEHNADDVVIDQMIDEATELIQDTCEIQLLDATAKLYLDKFPSDGVIEIGRPPVSSIDSIEYVDTDGATQTVSTWLSDLISRPARLTPAYGAVWPATRSQPNAVTITFGCGAASVAEVSPIAHRLICHLCGIWYENRVSRGQLPAGSDDLYFHRNLDLLRWFK